MNVSEIIRLSDLLAELSDVKRGTKLPNGENESDAHHSFSLALIAYDICQKECPELDLQKVLLFALTHDLLEIVTGDEDTLRYDAAALAAKRQREMEAIPEFNKLFEAYPSLKQAMHEYDRLDTPEAAIIFVLDKACTTWTHFHDQGKHARENRKLTKSQDIEDWADRQRTKMTARLKTQPPKAILDIYEDSFKALKGLYIG